MRKPGALGHEGSAFDGGRGYLIQAKLSQAADAAALADGRWMQIGAPDIRVSSAGDLTNFRLAE